MTLGGLALAVGILVDDATVTIENINYHLEQGKEVEAAILDGAHQIALPALVSTLSICIVFVPMFLLAGIAKFLFIPLAEAVVFAMLASYVLSRTLVPTLAKFWLKKHGSAKHKRAGFLSRFQTRFEHGFEKFRDSYHALLSSALSSGPRFAAIFLGAMIATAVLAFPLGPLPGLGQDFFPTVDGGQIKLHVRARTGTRIEETASLCDQIEATIRTVIPAKQLGSIVDNLGLPYSGINLMYSTSAPVGPGDADIYINLTADHRPTVNFVRELRKKLAAAYPSTQFAFLPADMIGQILNFGLPSPIDVQIVGADVQGKSSVRQPAVTEAAHHPWRGRLARSPSRRLSAIQCGCRQDQGATGRAHRTIGRGKHVGVPLRELSDVALVLGRPQKRHAIPGCHANSAVPAAEPQRSGQYALERRPQWLLTASGQSLHHASQRSPHAVVSHYNATVAIDIFGATWMASI